MTSSIIYNGSLRTTCTHLQSGNNFETDAPLDNNGKGERFSPTDLMATSLGTCMITVMGIKAQKIGVDLSGVKIDILKTMKAEPRRISAIDLHFNFPENLDAVDISTKTMLKEVGCNCPVQFSIHPDITVNIDWGAWK